MLIKLSLVYDRSLLAIESCETSPTIYYWTSANNNKVFWKKKPKFEHKNDYISKKFEVAIEIGDPTVLRCDDTIRFMCIVLSPNAQSILVGSKAGVGSLYIKDLVDATKNGSPIEGTMNLRLRSYPDDVFQEKDGFVKGYLNYTIKNEDTLEFYKFKFHSEEYMVKPEYNQSIKAASNRLLEEVIIANLKRNMAPFVGERSLSVDFCAKDEEIGQV